MLTGAERSSLALTLGFLLLGSGIKLWRKAEVEFGPFPTATSAPAAPTAASPDSAPGAVPASADPSPESRASADAAPEARADDSAAAIAVPGRGDGPAPEAAAGGRDPGSARERAPKRKAPPAGKVDANRATADELAAVPGIGPKTAAAIVAYRRERGAFRDLAQLREVKGIGERKWAVIAPCLSVASERGRTAGDTGKAAPPVLRP